MNPCRRRDRYADVVDRVAAPVGLEDQVTRLDWLIAKVDARSLAGLPCAVVDQFDSDLLVGSEAQARAIECVWPLGKEAVRLANLGERIINHGCRTGATAGNGLLTRRGIAGLTPDLSVAPLGRLSRMPGMIRLVDDIWLTLTKDASETWYLEAMPLSVSPARTTWVALE